MFCLLIFFYLLICIYIFKYSNFIVFVEVIVFCVGGIVFVKCFCVGDDWFGWGISRGRVLIWEGRGVGRLGV